MIDLSFFWDNLDHARLAYAMISLGNTVLGLIRIKTVQLCRERLGYAILEREKKGMKSSASLTCDLRVAHA